MSPILRESPETLTSGKPALAATVDHPDTSKGKIKRSRLSLSIASSKLRTIVSDNSTAARYVSSFSPFFSCTASSKFCWSGLSG